MDCPGWAGLGDPSGCTSTNTGDGLRTAGNQFGNFGREQAVWVVVLLSDGVANAAIRVASSPPEWVCPPSTWDGPPYCQDGDPGPSLAPPRADSDPDFDAGESAFYYVRVLEIPTPRWVLYDKLRLGAEIPEGVELIHQERAYTSPIWYTP